MTENSFKVLCCHFFFLFSVEWPYEVVSHSIEKLSILLRCLGNVAVHYQKNLLVSRSKNNQSPPTRYSAEPNNKEMKRVACERELAEQKSWLG